MNHYKLIPSDLLSLEDYARQRDTFRQRILRIKKDRQVPLGEHLRIIFENKDTIHYQVQEVLRIEKIFEAPEIEEELAVYNALIPTGNNLKAILMLEYSDEKVRKKALAELIGIEKSICLSIAGHNDVYPICNEDLERETAEKTASVHFMRFELDTTIIADFINGKASRIIIDHPYYQADSALLPAVQKSLAQDFDQQSIL